MVHPDHETRIGAHRIFSVVLVPSSVRPHISSSVTESKNVADFARTLSRTVSVFSSSAALFEKLRNEKSSSRENVTQENKQNLVTEGQQQNGNNGMLNRIKSAYSRGYSMKSSPVLPIADEGSTNNSNKELVGSEFSHWSGNFILWRGAFIYIALWRPFLQLHFELDMAVKSNILCSFFRMV